MPEPTDVHVGFGGYLLNLSGLVASAAAPGFLAGLIVGGVGSRLAMRVMAVTSGASVQGTETDFGATVGAITLGGTLFLLLAGGAVGVLGSLIFLAVRRWLPGKWWMRGPIFGILLLAVFGRLIIDSDNRDFAVLDPAALAIGMFAAIFVVYGLLFALFHEWAGPKIIGARTRWALVALNLVLLIPLLLTGILGILFVAIVGVGFAVHRSESFMRFWATRSVEVAGHISLMLLFAYGASQLAREITEIV